MVQRGRSLVPLQREAHDPASRFSSSARKDSPRSSSPSRAHPPPPCYRRRSPRPSCPRPTPRRWLRPARPGGSPLPCGGRRRRSHMLNRERDRLLGGESGRRSGEAKPEGGGGKQFDHGDSSQEFSRSGANKPKAIAPAR